MVLINGFQEATALEDTDWLLIERPGAQSQYFKVSIATLKSLFAASQPTVSLLDPIVRYSGAAGSKITHESGLVSRWVSESEINSNDLIVSGSGISRIEALNGKAVIGFSGSGGSFLSSSTSLSNVCCGFVVCNHGDGGTTFTDFRRIIDFGDNPGSLFGVSGSSNYSPASFSRNIAPNGLKVNGQVSNLATPLASYKILFFSFDNPVTGKFWVGTYSGTGNQLFKGNIADIILFDKYLSLAQEADWQTALAKEWGI